MDDNEIRAVVKRLSRPHSSGGEVIECAAILAAGADYQAIMEWIINHDGQPEGISPAAAQGGLHGSRLRYRTDQEAAPTRFVLPAGALA